MAMNIIVDDRDPSIRYSSGWITTDKDRSSRGQVQEFQGTTSQSGEQGSTASFTFTGNQIAVFGTLNNQKQVNLEFTIDGKVTPVMTPSAANAKFHQPIFSSNPLSDGQHMLLMKVNSPDASPFFFDYLIYKTNSRANSGQTVLIDDQDPGPVVSFPGPWKQNNTFDFMQQTSRYIGQQGGPGPGSAMVTYSNFLDGDTLTLFGALTSADPQFSSSGPLSATVSIDGGGPVSLPSHDTPSPGQTIFNQKLFSSSPLSAGAHTFEFSYNSGTPLGVDYFLIGPGSGSSGGSSGGSGAGSASGSNGTNTNAASASGTNSDPTHSPLSSVNITSFVTSKTIASVSLSTDPGGGVHSVTTTIVQVETGLQTSTSTPGGLQAQGPTSAAKASSSRIPLIAGVVCGALTLFLALLLLLCIWRKRRRQRKLAVDDFLLIHPAAATSGAYPPVYYGPRDSLVTLTDPSAGGHGDALPGYGPGDEKAAGQFGVDDDERAIGKTRYLYHQDA
ncbi:hypothetical protein MIND_00124100 [Mycena indigotica]|uniref:Uncharacterized protein n=1 Tax=Mycena indigotica TaxID=2126181 RepID=A0A8H6TG55_9AGAR|nr:uncharacterized protein MIND_00124100 [Mycena indigotica]KAF7316061.1 hypothetical protein MIND_00124100 [Mycena indigotica]